MVAATGPTPWLWGADILTKELGPWVGLVPNLNKVWLGILRAVMNHLEQLNLSTMVDQLMSIVLSFRGVILGM